jgi:hypothetical protein
MYAKRLIILVLLVALAGPALFGQDALGQLSKDLQTVFDEMGKEIAPNLQTASVLNHGLGSAQIGDFPHMYFSVSAGATVAPGVLKFTGDEEKFDNYSLLSNFLEEADLGEDADIRDITDNYAPYPSLRAGFGVGLTGGWEIDVQAGVVPQAIIGMIPAEGVTANITTLGGRVRKVVVRQEQGIPAVSVGLGYVYSGIAFGYDLADLDPIDAGGGTTLDLDGEMTFQSATHSFGTDVRVSTRLLRVLYPFVGASGYYQATDYKAGIDGFSALVGGSTTPVQANPEPLSEQTFNNFNVVLNTGMDIKLAIFNLFAHLNYAVTTQAPGAIVGFRIQI